MVYVNRLIPLLDNEDLQKVGSLLYQLSGKEPQIYGVYVFKTQEILLRIGTYQQGNICSIRIFNFFVAESLRKRGVGKSTIYGFIKVMEDKCMFKFIELQAENQEVAIFWSKLGFRNYEGDDSGYLVYYLN